MQWCAECDVEVPANQRYCGTCGSLPTDPPLPDDPPPTGLELALVRIGAVSDIRSLSIRLRAAGIQHWIMRDPSDDSIANVKGDYGRGVVVNLVVGVRDLERAVQIREEDLRATLPDIPAGFSFDADGDGCPACGAPLAAEAMECRDCGISFAGDR